MTTLPPLYWIPSPNFRPGRNGRDIRLIVVHDCEGNYAGAINWFAQKASDVSAHFVIREDGGEATQMVQLYDTAWHAVTFNAMSIGVEMAGFAKKGFGDPEWHVCAAIVAGLLKLYNLPCNWSHDGEQPGFCSHYDLGAAGGGHTDPTRNHAIWSDFVLMVQESYDHVSSNAVGEWRAGISRPAPMAPPHFVPTPTTRRDK